MSLDYPGAFQQTYSWTLHASWSEITPILCWLTENASTSRLHLAREKDDFSNVYPDTTVWACLHISDEAEAVAFKLRWTP